MNPRIYPWIAALALTGALAACGENRTGTSATDGTGSDSTAQTTPGIAGDATTAPGDTTTTGAAGAPGTSPDDAALAARVKSALDADTGLIGKNISVETVGGRVILSGQVDDNKEVQRATEIAGNVEGVSSVDNRLTTAS
jgi:hyperosmotically inducible protein